jgi:hypothetical protein
MSLYVPVLLTYECFLIVEQIVGAMINFSESKNKNQHLFYLGGGGGGYII